MRLLQQRKSIQQNFQQNLIQIAKGLEESLYRSAQSTEAYNDTSTLVRRLTRLSALFRDKPDKLQPAQEVAAQHQVGGRRSLAQTQQLPLQRYQLTNSGLAKRKRERSSKKELLEKEIDDYYRFGPTLYYRKKIAKKTMRANDISPEEYVNKARERKKCPVCSKNTKTFTFQNRKHLISNQAKTGDKVWKYCPLVDPPHFYHFMHKTKEEQSKRRQKMKNEWKREMRKKKRNEERASLQSESG